jgi:AcrR family transcriptional regulator
MATREDAKEQRRRQIVSAARVLMQKTGKTGFSMRALADEAGVSIATPYNLFGSKQTVMFAVLDADLQQYLDRLQRLRADEVDVFFKAVSLTSSLYASEPNFYRAVLFAAYNGGGTKFRSIFDGPRHAMWKRLVTNGIDAEVIRGEVDPTAFAINLGYIFFSCILEWVNNVISLEEMEAKVQYGFAISLHGVATAHAEERLWERVKTTQRRVTTLHNRRFKRSAAAKSGPAQRVNGAA